MENKKIIEDGCGGVIYNILDISNSGLSSLEIAMCIFNPGELAELNYHTVMQEIYFIIEGEGEVEMNGVERGSRNIQTDRRAFNLVKAAVGKLA